MWAMVRVVMLVFWAGAIFGISRAQASTCDIAHWTWRNMTADIVMIEGVISPASLTFVYIQAYDAQQNYLGNATGVVHPGGGFEAFVKKSNHTEEMTIRYTCE